MGEFNHIHVVNENHSANAIPSNSVGSGGNPLGATPRLVEQNDATASWTKKRRRTKSVSKVVSLVVAAAGAVMLGTAVADELDILRPIIPIVQPSFNQNNAEISIMPDVGSMSYWVRVVDYKPLYDMTVAVLDADGNKIQEEKLWQSAEEDALIAEGVAADLQPATEYVLALYDGSYQVYTQPFTTQPMPAPSYLLDNVEVSLSATETTLLYYIGLPDYEVVDSLHITVDNDDGFQLIQAVALDDEGELEGLQPDTQYRFCIYDGERLLYQAQFHTEVAAVTYSVEVSISPSLNHIIYYISISDYQPQNDLHVLVAAADGSDEGQVQWPETNLNDFGALVAEGEVAELTPATAYVFYVYDGDTLLRQEEFSTEAAPQYQIEVELSPDGMQMFYYMQLWDYDMTSGSGSFMAVVESDAGTQEQEIGWEEGELSGQLIAEGGFADLSPGITYHFYVYDGETVVYQDTFQIEEATQPVEVHISADISAMYYMIRLVDYEPQNELIAMVVCAEDSQEQELGFEEDEDGVPVAEGSFTDLMPDTAYVFYLYDGDTVLYQEEFQTAAA